MDTRYLPFYGGLYGGSLQPYLYSLYSGYGTPFGMYGNAGYGNFGFPIYGYGGHGFPGYGGIYSYGMPFGFYDNFGYGQYNGYGNYCYGD